MLFPNKTFISILSLYLFTALHAPVSGANVGESSWHSILFGLNPYNFKNDRKANGHGITVAYSYTHQKHSNKIITFLIDGSFEVVPPMAPYNTPLEYLGEMAVLYGKFVNYKNIHFSASIGCGLIGGINRGKTLVSGYEGNSCEKLPYFSIGIPIKFQINSNSSGSGGMGLQLFGNANTKQFIFGLALLVKIGKQGNIIADGNPLIENGK